LVGFVIPISSNSLDECQDTPLLNLVALPIDSEQGYCSQLWTNCSITAHEAVDTQTTGGIGTLRLPENIASAIGSDLIPLCWDRHVLLMRPDSLSEETPQPSLPLVVTFLQRRQENSDGSMRAPATISLYHDKE
jgi:hypothetical protein